MLLNAEKINALLRTKAGKLAQVGIDLTVKEIKVINGGRLYKSETKLHDYSPLTISVDDEGREGWWLIPGNAYSVTFEQGIELDNKHAGMITHRSSLLRMGWSLMSGIYDPSFYVEEMGAVMRGDTQIFVEKGARIAQIIIHECYESQPYQGQWLGNKDVK
jgi:deoxycytidine triphosphate deaminase